mmetsp:Transcript_26408/g.83656  ORF Transcript_26408/g.83656 Transcript_26408/m.83656 type:complete len:540 (+) Transcript_26408:109-1728(+)
MGSAVPQWLVAAAGIAAAAALLQSGPGPTPGSRGQEPGSPLVCLQACGPPKAAGPRALRDSGALLQVDTSVTIAKQGASLHAPVVAPLPDAPGRAVADDPCSGAFAEPGTGMSSACSRLGLLERLALAAVRAPNGPHVAVGSWLQLVVMSKQSSPTDGFVLIVAVIVVAVILIGAGILFMFRTTSGPTRTYQKMEDEAASARQESNTSSERPSIMQKQSLLPVDRMQSLPPSSFAARQPLAWQGQPLDSTHAGLPPARVDMLSVPRDSTSTAPNNIMATRQGSASSMEGSPQPSLEDPFQGPALKSSPLPLQPRQPRDVLKPPSTSPAGQGLPGGRLTGDSGASPARHVEMPPALCTLVLPFCEAHFAVPVAALAAVDESDGGSLEVLGLSGHALLRATCRRVPGGRLLELSMAHPGSAPRATIGPPAQPAAKAPVASPRMPALEIRGTAGAAYGMLEPRSSSCYVVTAGHRELLTIQGGSDGLEFSVSVGDQQVAEATCSSENFAGAEHLELRLQPGIDVVLVLSCILAILLHSTSEA